MKNWFIAMTVCFSIGMFGYIIGVVTTVWSIKQIKKTLQDSTGGQSNA